MTQPELNALFASLAGELRALGIPLSKDIDPQPAINTRAQRRLGCCVHREGRYTIQVSQCVLDDPRLLRTTLAHELLHTCPGCLNHGPAWKILRQNRGGGPGALHHPGGGAGRGHRTPPPGGDEVLPPL